MSSITDVRTVLPQIVKATFKGFGGSNDSAASSWGWTPLLKVADIVRVHFAQHGVGELRDFGLGVDMKDDIFGRYGLLNGHKDGKPLHTWAAITSIGNSLVINGERPVHPPADPHFIHVPMGWAKNVIAASEGGIKRVTCILHDTGLKYGSSHNSSIKKCTLIGHEKSGKSLEAIIDGSGGYRYLPLSQ